MDFVTEILKLIRESGEMRIDIATIKVQMQLILTVGGFILAAVFTNLVLNVKTHRKNKKHEGE